MSFLTPERVPVKVYKWDDVGAPALDKTAGCMMTIFKACLITGYGTKEPAGWTMPFEDTTAGVKVFRPEVGPHTDFYLRCSADNGTQMTSQVYLNMTAQNKGTLKLQCASAFKYAKRNSTGKWLLIASPRGFWFFCDQRFDGDVNKTGAYFYVGDLQNAVDSEDAVYLQHTGGSFDDAGYNDIFGRDIGNEVLKTTGAYVSGKVLIGLNTVITTDLSSAADSMQLKTTYAHLTPLTIVANNKLYILSGAYSPTLSSATNNYEVVNVSTNGIANMITHSTGGRFSIGLYINTQYWSY